MIFEIIFFYQIDLFIRLLIHLILFVLSGVITCTSEICTVDYYWTKSVHDQQYESSNNSTYCVAGASSSKAIESAITACIAQDLEIFKLYEIAVPLMISSNLESQSPTRLLVNQKLKPKMISMTQEEWLCLIRYADKETLSLPIFDNSPKKMTTNCLLLKMLGLDLSKYSARTLNIVPILPDGSASPLKDRRTSFNISKKITSVSELDETRADNRDKDKDKDEMKAHYDYRMVISSGNFLIFVEFPDVAFFSSHDSINLNPSFNDNVNEEIVLESTQSDAPEGQSDCHKSVDESYVPDSQEYEGASIDGSQEFCGRLSRSSSAHSGYGNLSPTSIGRTGTGDINKNFSRSSSGKKKLIPRKKVLEYSKTCEISLYSLELPTLQFADVALKSIVAEAVSSLSKVTSPESAKVCDTGSFAIREDLKSYLLGSHMSNFTSVLCASLCQGLVVAPGDILLGLERCHQSTYEVDISVMCRKRYLANVAAPCVDGVDPSVGSLCSAFENTLGKMLKGLEEGNVFVLCGNAPLDVLVSLDGTDNRSESSEIVEQEAESDAPERTNDKGTPGSSKSWAAPSKGGAQGRSNAVAASMDPKVLTNGAPRIIDNIDNSLVDKLAFSGCALSPPDRVSASFKDFSALSKSDSLQNIVVLSKSSQKSEVVGRLGGDENAQDVSPVTHGPMKSILPKGRAVFVRFAVVSRTEKAVGTSSQISSGNGTGTLGHLGSSGSYQSFASGHMNPSSASIVSLGAAPQSGI